MSAAVAAVAAVAAEGKPLITKKTVAGYVLEDVLLLTNYLHHLPIVVHKSSPRGTHFRRAGPRQRVKNELPSTFEAYRHQQHRWSRWSTNLFKKMALEIIQNKKVSFWKKVHLLYSFFFLRKFVAHTVTFIFYCVLIPLAVLFPEVVIPFWGAVYVPAVIMFSKCMGTPSSIQLFVTWVLFENVMSLHRLKAAFTGLFEAEQVDDRITTEKVGDINTSKPVVIDMMEADKLVESQLTESCIPKSKKNGR